MFKRAVAAEREELKQVLTSGEKAVNTEVIGDAVEQRGRRRGSHWNEMNSLILPKTHDPLTFEQPITY